MTFEEAAQRATILTDLARDVDLADLELVLTMFPNLIPEAVREAKGEVHYEKVEEAL